MKRWITVLLAALLMTAAVAQPASANPSRGYVDGTALQSDDLLDEAELRRGGPYWRSNYTAFFQLILWAEGHLNHADVDCEFGPRTEQAAFAWQTRWQLPRSGKFDWSSREFVGRYIVPDPNGNPEYFRFVGTHHSIPIHRWGSGAGSPYRYDVDYNPGYGDWHGVWYNTVNVAAC